jgi:hypothetical protein
MPHQEIHHCNHSEGMNGQKKIPPASQLIRGKPQQTNGRRKGTQSRNASSKIYCCDSENHGRRLTHLRMSRTQDALDGGEEEESEKMHLQGPGVTMKWEPYGATLPTHNYKESWKKPREIKPVSSWLHLTGGRTPTLTSCGSSASDTISTQQRQVYSNWMERQCLRHRDGEYGPSSLTRKEKRCRSTNVQPKSKGQSRRGDDGAGINKKKHNGKLSEPQGGLNLRLWQVCSFFPAPGGGPQRTRKFMPPVREWLFLCPVTGVGSTDGKAVGDTMLPWVRWLFRCPTTMELCWRPWSYIGQDYAPGCGRVALLMPHHVGDWLTI